MAKKESTKTKAVSAEEEEPPPWAEWFTRVAFVLTLALMIGRALMSESVRDAFDVVPQSTASAAPAAPGPATTMVLDALCCLPAVLVLIRRAIDREYRIRLAPSQGLLMLAALIAAFSFFWSSDRFLTLIAAANFVAAATLVWSTAQLVRSWLRLRIVAGVCLGLLLAYCAHGLIREFVDHRDDIRFWNENKSQILSDRGWAEGSFEATQFEKKVLAGEMVGFNQSANSFAAVLVMLIVISAGVAIARRKNGDGVGWTLAILAVIAVALFVLKYTDSRTATGTFTLSVLAMSALSTKPTRDWLPRHTKSAYWMVVGFVLLGTIAMIGHGIAHGSLPQDSLNFRWRYWVASARLVKMHPILGVGWGDYGEHYVSVRLPAAAEEIKDPHNFIVRAFSELGIIGGIVVIAWLMRAAWEITRPNTPGTVAKPKAAASVISIVAILALGIGINLIASIDWSSQGAYVKLELFKRLLFAGLICVGMLVVLVRGTQEQRMDDRPAPWLIWGMTIALGAFFVHTMMDFVLAEAGPMTMFAVVLGSAIGVRTNWRAQAAEDRRKLAIGAAMAASVAWVVAVVAMVIPAVDAEQQALAGDDAVRANRAQAAIGLYQSAFQSVRYNADYAYRAARAMMIAGENPNKVNAMLEVAIAADPMSVLYRLTRANYEARLPQPDANAVRNDYEKALSLDPKNLSVRLDYADQLIKFGDKKAAAEQYRQALVTSDGYDKTEPKRLALERVEELNKKIANLENKN